jgi:hypothetical protein
VSRAIDPLGAPAPEKNRVHPIKIHSLFCNNFAVCSFSAKEKIPDETDRLRRQAQRALRLARGITDDRAG